MKNLATRSALVVAAALLLSACATTTTGMLRASSSKDAVFGACVQAVADVNFAVTSTDRTTGLIVAQKDVTGSFSKVARMNITVQDEKGSAIVQVSVVPPGGTFGTTRDIVEGFATALKRRVPDAVVMSIGG